MRCSLYCDTGVSPVDVPKNTGGTPVLRMEV